MSQTKANAIFAEIVGAARALVTCADEFEDCYPEACSEYLDQLIETIDAYGKYADSLPVLVLPRYEA